MRDLFLIPELETVREKALRHAYEAEIERVFINCLSAETTHQAVDMFKKGLTKADVLYEFAQALINSIEAS